MATVYHISGKERSARLKTLADQLAAFATESDRIQAQAESYIRSGIHPSTISTKINALLTALSSDVAALATELGSIGFAYQEVVKPGCPALHNATIVDHANTSGHGHVRDFAGGTPFAVFQANDVIQGSGGADSPNNIPQTVSSIYNGGTGMILSAGANMTDNAADFGLAFTLMSRG